MVEMHKYSESGFLFTKILLLPPSDPRKEERSALSVFYFTEKTTAPSSPRSRGWVSVVP